MLKSENPKIKRLLGVTPGMGKALGLDLDQVGRLARNITWWDGQTIANERLREAGFDPVYGARPLKRAIQSQLENPLAQEILAGRFSPGDVVEVENRAALDDMLRARQLEPADDATRAMLKDKPSMTWHEPVERPAVGFLDSYSRRGPFG